MSSLLAHKRDSILHKTLICTIINRFLTTPASPDLNNAASVFESVPQWNSTIKSHVDAGFFDTALRLFCAMRNAYLQPDHYTFPLINRTISSLPASINIGRELHCLGIKMGFHSDVYFCNTAIDMYFKCTCVASARKVFDEMHYRDVVTWTSMMSGYARTGHICESLRLFNEMRIQGLEPSSVTLSVMLRTCDADANGARQLHGIAIKIGCDMNELVYNSILTVYSVKGCFEEAVNLFSIAQKRSVVSWNIMMTMYLSIGDVSKVTDCFESMMAESLPSNETLTLVISAFARSKDHRRGQQVHNYAVKSGCIDAVMRSSLIDFYAKCGELESSIQLFDEVEARDGITWNVLMWGFIHEGQYKEATELFQKMKAAGFELSTDTLRALIVAYTHLGALHLGKAVHAYFVRNKLSDFLEDTILQTSLVNMYAKCGSIVLARKCFDGMDVKDTIAWSSMIDGYGIHGLGMKAMQLFYEMQEEGIKPNSVTFLSLLSACSHSGLLNEGFEVFDCMTQRFGVKPELNHYTCMVDLLGRSGKLHEALELTQGMDTEPDGRIWGALLASCRTHSDVRLGSFAAQRLLDLEPDNAGYQVVLSNIHTSHGSWDEAESIRKFMGERDFTKMPGWSCIEVQGGVHMFVAGDRSHLQSQEISKALGCLTVKIREASCCI